MLNKSKNDILLFDDSFGSQKDYFLYALKSPVSFYRFGKLLGDTLSCQFFFLTEFSSNNQSFTGKFRSFYTSFNKSIDYNCIIIENETDDFAEIPEQIMNYPKGNASRMLSLFKDPLFLINQYPSHIFKANISDYDYLILFYKNKDEFQDASSLSEIQLLKEQFSTSDISSILFANSELNKKNLLELQRLICNLTISVVESNKNKDLDILAPQKSIPINNLITGFSTTINYFIRPTLPLEYNPDYLRILSHEIDTL